MIHVVGLAGSPRHSGSTEALLDTFLDGAQAAGGLVSKIRVADLDLEGWTPEAGCPDGFQQVSEQLVAADVVAIASPIYFANVPAQLKALIDCGQAQWLQMYEADEPLSASAGGRDTRRGVLISTGGQDDQDFEGARKTVRAFFDVYQIEYWGDLLLPGVDDKDDLMEEPLAFQEAHDLGYRSVANDWQRAANGRPGELRASRETLLDQTQNQSETIKDVRTVASEVIDEIQSAAAEAVERIESTAGADTKKGA